ncbi:MAG TPA: hypothetical protein VJV78_26425 [Polyangiales bacterium]|nr:hypothetical protein [Polyangiales bacterium]
MRLTEEPAWWVIGWDTFEGEEYPVSQHATEAESKVAAHAFLAQLEREQPSASSGGQSGIQDRVFIVRPDGVRYRYLPS